MHLLFGMGIKRKVTCNFFLIEHCLPIHTYIIWAFLGSKNIAKIVKGSLAITTFTEIFYKQLAFQNLKKCNTIAFAKTWQNSIPYICIWEKLLKSMNLSHPVHALDSIFRGISSFWNEMIETWDDEAGDLGSVTLTDLLDLCDSVLSSEIYKFGRRDHRNPGSYPGRSIFLKRDHFFSWSPPYLFCKVK
jgi:hypothetical protein